MSIVLTVLPDPYPKCVRREPFASAFWEMLAILREDPAIVTTLCGHCLFSGHTATLTLTALLWRHIGHPVWSALAWALLGAEIFFMIVCRFHYTCDVVWAAMVSCIVFRLILPPVQPAPPPRGTRLTTVTPSRKAN